MMQWLLKLKQKQLAIIAVGLLLSTAFYFLHLFPTSKANLSVALGVLLVYLWVSEVVAMPVVALLPIILFPLFNLMPIDKVAESYGTPVIFLFMGGFMIGMAIEKWNLHKRIALTIVRWSGSSGNRITLGFIAATGLLSMWLSNTATTMMMFPIALSVIKIVDGSDTAGNKRNFAIGLLLVIAYASNFGGIATIIGTPPNVTFVAFIKKTYKVDLDFLEWMLVCTPIAILLLAALYFVITAWLFPNRIPNSKATNDYIHQELKTLGKLSVAERNVLIVFVATALSWIFRKAINSALHIELDDNMIAMIGGLALFFVNSGSKNEKGVPQQLLEWDDTKNMAWGILLLFGGGIALANQLKDVGVMDAIGNGLAHSGINNPLALVVLITIISIFLSEVMSNVAQVTVLSPVIGSLALALNINPLLLGLPMTLAASAASMLPMGTPPNAIVFGSGKMKMRDMIKAGFVLNIISIVLIILFCYYILPLVMGTVLPIPASK
jgi:solute carrier family 13 (sodium-dependent dicarboxylate transporter), member 2/3/5